MSTESEKPIPERWREMHDGPSLLTINDSRRVIEQLGDREALIRKLAEALQAVSDIRPCNWDDGSDPDQEAAWSGLDAALALVPKEPRNG